MTRDGRFTEAAMTTALHGISAGLNVSTEGVYLVGLTNNAVFVLPAAGVVVRITRSHVLHDRVDKVVRLGHWFAQVDATTIRLAPHLAQPVVIGRLLASVWEYVRPTEPAPTLADLGAILTHLHALRVPEDLDLPGWDPVGDARRRMEDAEALGDGDRAALHRCCDELAPLIDDLNARAGHGLVHGDAHVGNLLRTPGGDVVICDFDATCRGPWQVDLVPAAVGEQRFGRAGAHDTVATAYGYDVTTDPAWPVLRRARELKMVAAAVPLLASAPGVAAEFRTRLDSVLSGDDTTRWTPFADLSQPS